MEETKIKQIIHKNYHLFKDMCQRTKRAAKCPAQWMTPAAQDPPLWKFGPLGTKEKILQTFQKEQISHMREWELPWSHTAQEHNGIVKMGKCF